MIMLQTKEHQNKLCRKYVWSPQWQSEVRGLNSPHIHLGLVYPRLMRSEAVSLSLPCTNCLKYLSIIANKQHLVKWTEFIFLASSTIVLWPLLISPSEEHPLPFQQLFCFISWITCCCITSKPCPSSDLCLTVLKFDSVHFGSWKNSKVG